jgi:hypothetical protein
MYLLILIQISTLSPCSPLHHVDFGVLCPALLRGYYRLKVRVYIVLSTPIPLTQHITSTNGFEFLSHGITTSTATSTGFLSTNESLLAIPWMVYVHHKENLLIDKSRNLYIILESFLILPKYVVGFDALNSWLATSLDSITFII